ncbi:MAG: hypothetical protein ACKN9Z_00475 [Actinomycetota bacterium]
MNAFNHFEDNAMDSDPREGGVPFTSGGPMNISVTPNEQDQAFFCDGAQATLEDKIKTLIDNTFRRKADDLTNLQRKIDNLTMHLTNELDQTLIDDKAISVSSCIDDHVTNDQPILIHVIPSTPDQGLKDEAKLRRILNYSDTRLWHKLTGGGESRFFAKDLEKHTDIYNYVMDELQYYITYAQMKFPKLIHVKGGAILSAPHAPAQIDGHNGKLHSDYTADVSQRPLDERPVSIIVAVDPFALKYLPNDNMMRKDIQKICVRQREMVMFTSACLHSGDTNESNEYRLRLFAYLVSNEKDFPQNHVTLFDWSDNTENARIASAAMPSEKEKFRRLNSKRQRKVHRSNPNCRLRYETERYGVS